MSSNNGELQNEYLQLLDLMYEVAQSLKGKQVTDGRLVDLEQLTGKFFYHAASIYWLRQGTKVPVPRSVVNGASFFDTASVTVLARAALETYLTMFEVFFEPATDDDFEYNHALWQLSGFIIREGFVPTDPSLAADYARAQKEIEEIRDRLRKTQKFNTLTPNQQKVVLRGKRTREWAGLAKGMGIGKQTIGRIYAYQSSYVHADGLSGAQLVSARTAAEQIELIETNMHFVMIVMSKMILDYA